MIRTLVADDSVTVRKARVDRWRRAATTVIGETSDGRMNARWTRRLRPDAGLMDVLMPDIDVLILDLIMPCMHGRDVIRALKVFR